MKVEPIYYKDFTNFLHTAESDEERAAMVALAIRSEKVKAMNEMYEEIERILTNGNN